VKKPIALLLRLESEHEQALNEKLDDKKPILSGACPIVGHAPDLGGRYLFPIWQQQ
jgi:hypothetical protein